jgi:tetratricopeptide (TPR) repeat protein
MTEYASSLAELGAFYCFTEEFARAEVLLRQAADILTKAVAKLPYPYLQGLINVGEQYLEREDCVQAAKDRRQVLAYASCLDLLSRVFRAQGHYIESEEHAKKAARFRALTRGEKHPVYAQSLHSLAQVYRATGKYAQAEECFQAALKIEEKTLGKVHVRYAATLNELGELYLVRGDYNQADSYLRQSLQTYEKTIGDEHILYARGLTRVGRLHEKTGDLAAAEHHYRKAIALYENKRRKGLGYGEALHSLALLIARNGDPDQAERLVRQSREIAREVLGSTYKTRQHEPPESR